MPIRSAAGGVQGQNPSKMLRAQVGSASTLCTQDARRTHPALRRIRRFGLFSGQTRHKETGEKKQSKLARRCPGRRQEHLRATAYLRSQVVPRGQMLEAEEAVPVPSSTPARVMLDDLQEEKPSAAAPTPGGHRACAAVGMSSSVAADTRWPTGNM